MEKVTSAGCEDEVFPGKVASQVSTLQWSLLLSDRMGSYRTSPGVDCLAFKSSWMLAVLVPHSQGPQRLWFL